MNCFKFFSFLCLIACLKSTKNYQNCSIQKSLSAPDELPDFPDEFNETALIIELDAETTDARCLDGSNVKFNFSKGVGFGSKKFIFQFKGGGFCGIVEGKTFIEGCVERSTTYLGSSKAMPPNQTVKMIDRPIGLISSSPKNNPRFWNWNKIGTIYCDGSVYQGYLKDPINVNGTNLWFRGYNNTLGVFEYARKNLGLFEAEEIIISGESSGGQMVFVWASYLQDYFPKNIKIRFITDAGFFIDEYNSYAGCNLFGYYMKKIANITQSNKTDLFRKCKYKDTEESWKCLLPQFASESIEYPLFMMNSQNDFVALVTHYGIECLVNGTDWCNDNDNGLIYKFREAFLNQIFILKEKHPNWGFWLRNCVEHIYWKSYAWYTDKMRVYSADLFLSLDLKSAIFIWLDDLDLNITNSHTYIDIPSWNHTCLGHFLSSEFIELGKKIIEEDEAAQIDGYL